jgi:acetyl esterase
MAHVTAPFDPQFAAATRLAAEIAELLGPPAPGVAGVRDHAQRARAWWNEGGPKMARELDVQVTLPHRAIDAVVYVPTEGAAPRPAYVFLHGGGYRIGSPRSSDRMLRELAQAWGGMVVSLDYVHVPEHVFPQAVEDTAAAYAWIAQHGSAWGIDGTRLAFGGSSAGANVAMGAAIHAGADAMRSLRAAAMLVGVFDRDPDSESMRLYGGEGFFPTRASGPAIIEAYVPDPARRTDPRVNCVAAELRSMPPMFLAAAGADVYRDSSRRMAAALREAGRSCELVEYAGMGHLFGGYTRLVDGARQCVQDMARFLRERLPAT